jgi:ribosomal protein L11 methylase PrmA
MDEVETEIEEVVKEIKVVEARLSQSQLGLLQLPVEEITYLLKKEERLCTREEQLRKDKDWLRLKEDRPLKEAEQIREKELISLRNSDKRKFQIVLMLLLMLCCCCCFMIMIVESHLPFSNSLFLIT